MSITSRLLFIFVLAAALCFAQTSTARLDGTVTDATGSIVPNAKVTAVNVKTRVTAETTSNATGAFAMAALQPGTYTLTVEAAGFRKSVVNDVQLDNDAYVTQKVTLEVGQVTESVEVKANTLAVQTTDSQVSRAVTLKDIDTLPQLGRTPLTLAIFQPGVQISQNGSSAGVDTSFSRINGTRQGSQNNTLDGIDVNDAVVPRLGLSLTANNSDTVAEFRVITEGGKAEYGRNAGGQVELITRSGTNEWHGNLFDYIRNTDLNANDFFSNASGVARPQFIQNIYGGSIGAPIKHNKLFIFGNFQGRRTHQTIVRNRTVPTDLAKSGIFQWKAPGSSVVQQYNVLLADPRKRGIDPFMANLLKLYPSANNLDVGDGLNSAGFRFNNPNGSLEDQFTIKGDYNLTNNHHFFYRHSWQRNTAIDSLNNADANFPGEAQGTQGGHRWGVAGGWDWTLGPSLVNEFRYGHQSATVAFNRPERVPGTMVSTFNNGWTQAQNAAFGQGRNSPVNEYTDNITKIRGNHTFKAGANLRFTTQFGYNDGGIYPNISLSTANGNLPATAVNPTGPISTTDLTTFQGLYNNLLGRVSIINQTFLSDLTKFQAPGTTSIRNFVFHEYGYFLQDDWKIRRNLTFNIGLRWEFSGVPYEKSNQQGILNNVGQFSSISNLDNLTVQKSSKWYNNDWNNFAPRFGFAWDPKGDGKMAIRGGYAIFYDRIIGATTSLVDGNTPGFSSGPLVPDTPNSAGGDIRIGDNPALPQQPTTPVLTLPLTRSFSAVVFKPNLATGYVQQWSLTAQRELARNTVLEVGYLGNRGVKLFADVDLNQTRIYGDFLSSVQQITANITNLSAVPASNTLVKIFGSAQAAVSALGSTNFTNGLARTLADNLDSVASNNSKYAAAGVSNFYLRNFPQFFQLIYGNNDGRSYYDSLQASLRRTAGALRMTANYTFSKSMDNISVDGNGFTSPIDNFNFGLNRARADFDRPHVFSFTGIYTLPIGKGHRFGGDMPRWADSLLGGWDFGALAIWESGSPMTISSGRTTGPSTNNSWINYGGDRNVGDVLRQGNGVFYFTPAQISTLTDPGNFPLAGSIGTAGRNSFRGPRYFNIDASLVKKFKITEKHSLLFRAEAYNLVNNPNFANPAVSIATPQTFGKIAGVVANARILQGALRYEF
jgi:hypothetical protein